jgi:MOSC domain-containing protein YiiM
MNRQLLTVSTGTSAALFYGNQSQRDMVQSAIRKSPVSSMAAPKTVRVTPMGIEGDEQSDLSVHGGLDKAVYVYPSEHYTFWQTISQQAGKPEPITHGKMGENLTISGLLERNCFVGDQLHLGSVILRIEAPRNPCFKFNAVMGFKHAAKMMMQSGFCGFYCSVIQPGMMTAGDIITIQAGEQVLSIEQRFAMTNRNRQQDLF